MLSNKKWKVYFYRTTYIVSILGVAWLASDVISDSISNFLFHNKPHGSIIAVVIGMIMFILEGFSYLFLKGFLVVAFTLVGWLAISRFIEKTSTYNSILSKTNKLSLLSGWLIWIGFSSLPLIILYFSANYEVMSKPEFKNIYKYGLIKLNGHIDETMTYKIQANYLARSTNRKCKAKLTDNIFSKSLDHKPQITKTTHAIIIPLDAVKESFCDYQIYTIKMCLTRKETKQKEGHKFACYTLFKAPDKNDSINEYLDYHIMYDGRTYQKIKNNKLNIYCGVKKGHTSNYPTCTQDLLKRKSITQYLQTGNQEYMVNIYDY